MKKYIGILIILFICSFSIECFAAEGTVKFLLQNTGCASIAYAKVASIKNGVFILEEEYDKCDVNLNIIEKAKEMEEAAEKLTAYMGKHSVIKANQKSEIEIPALEEGVYLFVFEGEKEITPMLVFVPTWMESEKEMVYDITAVPKYGEKPISPQTGWNDYSGIYLVILMFSAIIVVWIKKKI